MDADRETDKLMDDDEFARRFFETDLSDLPQPTRHEGRHPVLMVAVMVFSAILMWMFAGDTRYFLFERGEPHDLGDTMVHRKAHQLDPAHVPDGLQNDDYVRIRGLTAFRTESDKRDQAFLKMAYVPVYVHLRDDKPGKPSDHLVHLTVSGRLLDLTHTSRYLGVQRFYSEQFDLPTRRAFMLVAEDKPGSYWWTIPLQGLFILFILFNGWLLVRTLRS